MRKFILLLAWFGIVSCSTEHVDCFAVSQDIPGNLYQGQCSSEGYIIDMGAELYMIGTTSDQYTSDMVVGLTDMENVWLDLLKQNVGNRVWVSGEYKIVDEYLVSIQEIDRIVVIEPRSAR